MRIIARGQQQVTYAVNRLPASDVLSRPWHLSMAGLLSTATSKMKRDAKTVAIPQINTLKVQLDRVRQMVEDGKPSIDVMVQLHALRAALTRVDDLLFERELGRHPQLARFLSELEERCRGVQAEE